VYAFGKELVLKLYPPVYLDEQVREATVLELLHGVLAVPTPRLRSSGELGGWGYVWMDRLHGESLAQAWPRIPDRDRERLMTRVGEALRTLHDLRDPRMANIAPPPWPVFLEEQRRTAVDRQRRRGVDERWLERIPAFLETTSLGQGPADSLLHTEVMREHLLVRHEPGGWELSGLFDFEPARIGPPEYELASIGQFVSCADPALLGTLLRAYGHASSALDHAFSRRLMAHALLHKYSNLAWYLRRNPPPDGVCSFEDLATHWYGVA